MLNGHCRFPNFRNSVGKRSSPEDESSAPVNVQCDSVVLGVEYCNHIEFAGYWFTYYVIYVCMFAVGYGIT